MCCQWAAASLCYFGLSYLSTSLSGDPHVNFLLNMLVEVPGYQAGMHMAMWMGRNRALAANQMLSGIGSIMAGMGLGCHAITYVSALSWDDRFFLCIVWHIHYRI